MIVDVKFKRRADGGQSADPDFLLLFVECDVPLDLCTLLSFPFRHLHATLMATC